MTTEKPIKQASDLVSYQLRSRTVAHSDFQPRRMHHKAQTTVRLPTISEGHTAAVDENMATGGERRVAVTAESHDSDKVDKLQDQMLQLATQIDQLRMDLRRVNESNRELTEKNRELHIRTRAKIISDSVVAPKPFLGKTAEQDPVD
jgi:TolA-binding protein